MGFDGGSDTDRGPSRDERFSWERVGEVAAELADAVYVVQIEPDFHFEYVSQSVTRLIGYTPNDIYADPELAWRIVEPQDAAELRRVRRAPLGEATDFAVRWRHRDGQVVWTRNHVRRERRADGSIALFGAARDISSEERIRADLEASAERLRGEEYRARLVAENVTDIVMILGVDRGIQWVSAGVTDCLGWRADQLLGRQIAEFEHPEDGTADVARASDLDRGEPRERGESRVRLRTAGGGYRWILQRLTPLRDGTGELLGHVAGFRDVDELVRARERLRAVMDTQADPMVVLEAIRDNDGVLADLMYVDTNPAASTYLRLNAEDLIGRRVLEVFSGESAALLMGWCAKALMSAEPVILDAVAMSSAVTGRRLVADVRVVVVDTHTVSLTWRDVTDRDDQARLVAESEEMWRRTMQDSAIGMCTIAADGSFLTVNGALCAFFGYEPDELTQLTWQQLTHPEDLAVDLGKVQAVLDGHLDSYRLTKRYRHADGDYRVGDLSVSGIRDNRGSFLHFVSQIVDMTEQVRLTEELKRSRRDLQLLADYSTDVILRVGPDGIIHWASASTLPLLGWEPADVIGRRMVELVHPEERSSFEAESARVDREGDDMSIQARFRGQDGNHLWMDADGRQVPAPDDQPTYRVVRLRDIQDEVQLSHQLQYQANHDALTGLPNRAALVGRIDDFMARRGADGAQIAVLFCDLDGLKAVNDEFGHAMGDRFLQAMGGRLRSALRQDDVVARVGGDEFVVALGNVTDPEHAVEVARKLRGIVAEPCLLDGTTLKPSMSMGVTILRDDEPLDEAIARADHAMYEGKRRAPGQITTA